MSDELVALHVAAQESRTSRLAHKATDQSDAQRATVRAGKGLCSVTKVYNNKQKTNGGLPFEPRKCPLYIFVMGARSRHYMLGRSTFLA